jgi:hypothetical protein
MKRTSMLGLAVSLAFAVMGASAASVSATEHEFIASKSGKVAAKATNTQTFKTSVGKVECTAASGSGEVKEGVQKTNKEVITYSSCSGPGGKVTISSASFEFNANGTAKIEKNILVMLEGLGCHITIPGSQTVESISYTSESSGKVLASASIGGIHSFGSGGSCGTTEETSGTYSGDIQAELEGGGKLEWK